jgi:iron complex outermembrane receptor protein
MSFVKFLKPRALWCVIGSVFIAGILASPAAYAEIQTVIVTATPYGESSFGQSAAEVSRERLLKEGSFSLGDALKNVAGVTSSGFATGATRPVIRGFDASRVRVTENGLGSHDVSDISADHGVPVDPLSAVEIEVLRGPSTLRFGSQAIGGVVNAINNRIPIDIDDGTRHIDSFASYGSNSDERLLGALGDMRMGAFALHADSFVRDAGSYRVPSGKQENTYARGYGAALGAAGIGEDIAGGFAFNRYASNYGIPTEPGGEVANIDLKQNKYTGELRLTAPVPGIERIQFESNYADYHHDEIVQGEGIASSFNNNEWEGRAELLHKGFGLIERGALGIQAGLRDFEALGEAGNYLNPTKTNSVAAYIFEKIPVRDNLSLELALRGERVKAKGSTALLGAIERRFTPFSAAGGVIFQANERLSFSVNASRTMRAPNAVELFAQGGHEATGTFEFGDPTLEEEVSRSIEAGIHYKDTEDRRASFTVFRSAFRNFIFGMLTGNSYDEDGNFFPDDSEEFAELLYRSADAVFRGFESEAHLPLFDVGDGVFGVEGQIDYVRATFTGGGNVPRIPPLRYGGGMFFESRRFDVSWNILNTTAQHRVASNETPTEGYVILDAAATVRLFTGEDGTLALTLAGSNLTNEAARNHVSFTKDHVELPGRSVKLMLRFVN